MHHRAKIRSVLIFLALVGWLFVVPALLMAAGEIEMNPMSRISCADCHSSTSPKYPTLGAAEGYEHSGHNLGFANHSQNSYYANGNGCQQCHTNEGFIEYVETGKVEGYVNYPSQIGCFTCHAPHETGDFSVRVAKPVTLADGSVFNAGEGNLCANCHQARRAGTAIVVATPANKVLSHWGAHHGPQTDLVNGTNAFQNPAKSYSSSPHKMALKDSCVDCHMNLPEGRYSLSPEVGGHSFRIGGDVHGAEKLNVAACATCHKDIKQVRGEEIFDLKAKADYDNDGSVEYFQMEVEGLLERLVNSHGTGELQKLNPPMYKADGSWGATSSTRERSIVEMAALYNYKLIEEDRSLGVHNGVYIVQILMDSIEALNPSFDTSNRPR